MSLPGSPFATLPPSVPTIAHLRVGDLQRGLAQQRDRLAEQIGGDQLVLRRHRADDDLVAVLADPFQVRDAAEVDEVRRALASRSFIIGMRLWPPASTRPSSPKSASRPTASLTDVGR